MNDSLHDSIQGQFEWYTQLPWVFLVVLVLPLLLLAKQFRIYPSTGWVVLLSISVIACVLTIFFPHFLVLAAAIDLALLMVAGIDLVLLYLQSNHGIQAKREIPRTVSLGVPIDSSVTIENHCDMPLVGAVRDDLPPNFFADPDEHSMRLPRRAHLTAARKLTPGRRGAFELEFIYLKFRSRCRLWVRHRRLEVHDTLRVYPDRKQLSDYALLARTNRLSLIGVRKTRRVGQDSDFERLRDYSRDDNYRHIDWRSTARRRKLTVRQFQSDQSQRIIFMMDCGRMMTNTRNGYSLLDHAFNSMLMMAYVALDQGDSVGLLCFSDTIHSFIPPRGGSSQMNRLLEASFDQFPRMVESRYDQAFLYLSNHCKRRSLVVLATNVIDEVNAEAVVDHLGNISGQHLPLGIFLRDRQMFDAADAVADPTAIHGVNGEFALYRAAAAADILLWRDQVICDLKHKGVLTIDAFPDELTAPLVNQYLEVKAKHLL